MEAAFAILLILVISGFIIVRYYQLLENKHIVQKRLQAAFARLKQRQAILLLLLQSVQQKKLLPREKKQQLYQLISELNKRQGEEQIGRLAQLNQQIRQEVNELIELIHGRKDLEGSDVEVLVQRYLSVDKSLEEALEDYNQASFNFNQQLAIFPNSALAYSFKISRLNLFSPD